jgi:hypothetical protein
VEGSVCQRRYGIGIISDGRGPQLLVDQDTRIGH